MKKKLSRIDLQKMKEMINDENLAKTRAEHRPQNQDNWWWDE